MPYSVILVPAPPSFTNARRLVRSDLVGELFDHGGSDGRHILLQAALGAHRIWLRDVRIGTNLAALIPLDDNVLLRIAGLLRLQRRLGGGVAGPVPRGWELTARLRQRLVLMVRALDGHQAQASYREIALALYGQAAVARYPWKTSSIRGQTIRLVKDAVFTMEGGYRRLLRGGR
ncbi:MAG: DUF2285 domain-containing protein [Bradyrhizobium sp.]|nr:DUF2285 domain-containing protein [Bradyrhizobium sp.]